MLFLLCALVPLVMLTGCGRRGSDRSGAGNELDRPQAGGMLRIPVAGDAATLNPVLLRRGPQGDLWRLFYPSLITLESRGAQVPEVHGDLALRWDWSEESNTLTFFLRGDRFWQDTTRVGVDDVVRSYEAYRATGRIPAWATRDSLFDPGLVAVEKIDLGSLRMRFRPGWPLWRAWPAATWPIVPAAKLGEIQASQMEASSLGREVQSGGPFRLLEWRPGLNLWIGRNPLGPSDRLPLVRAVAFEPCAGVDTRILRLLYGQADVVTDVPVFMLRDMVESRGGVTARRSGVASVEMLFWNLGSPASVPAVREAVAYAIDRERIIDALLTWRGERYGAPAGGLLEPDEPAASADTVVAAPVKPAARPAKDTLGSRRLPNAFLLHPADSIPVDSARSGVLGKAQPDSAADGGAGADSVRVPSLAPAPFPRFNRARADSLLDLAGWTERSEDGFRMRGGLPLRIEMVYDRSNEFRERLATLLEEDLARVGIWLDPVPLDGAVAWQRFRSGVFETALLGFRPPQIPDVSPLWASWGYWNGGGYANARADSLIKAQAATSDPVQVERFGRELEAQIRRDRPVTYIIRRDGVDLLSDRVRGFAGTPSEPYRNLERVWLADTTMAATGGADREKPAKQEKAERPEKKKSRKPPAAIKSLGGR